MFADNFKNFIGILSIPVALEEDKVKNECKTLSTDTVLNSKLVAGFRIKELK